jgi:hypothetical protein
MTSFATPILDDCARGASDRSGFRPVAAVMPPMACVLPAWLSMTCRGLLQRAPGPFFFDQPSHACKHVRDGFVKAHPPVFSFQSIPLSLREFTLGKFQWEWKSLPRIPVTA